MHRNWKNLGKHSEPCKEMGCFLHTIPLVSMKIYSFPYSPYILPPLDCVSQTAVQATDLFKYFLRGLNAFHKIHNLNLQQSFTVVDLPHAAQFFLFSFNFFPHEKRFEF